MTPTQENEISDLINSSLDAAERKWGKSGKQLIKENEQRVFDNILEKSESTESAIPGHPIVKDNEAKVDEFIALVADMRDSSTHLMCASSQKKWMSAGYNEFFMKHLHCFLHLQKQLAMKMEM